MIDYAEEPLVDPEKTKETVEQMSRATGESDALWKSLISYLELQKEFSFSVASAQFASEDDKLGLIIKLIDLALLGEYIHGELETAAEAIRCAPLQTSRDKALRRQDYEKMKQTMWKQKLSITDKAASDARQKQWDTVSEKHKFRTLKHDVDLRRLVISKSLRNTPLGTDVNGNTYWLFGQRQNEDSSNDLGSKIIVEIPPHRCHLACSSRTVRDCLGCTPETTADCTIKRDHLWQEITTAESARQVCSWITHRAQAELKPKPKVIDGRSCWHHHTKALDEYAHETSSIIDSAAEHDQALLDTWIHLEKLVRRMGEYAQHLEIIR